MATTVATNSVGMAVSSRAYLESPQVKETSALLADLCRHFYTLGWVSGTGGSITIKVHDDALPLSQQLIVMSPSGVQKERMVLEDMYILSSNGTILSTPSPKSFPNKHPKCSDCAPLFLKAYDMRHAGSVIHSHGMESCLVTMINPLAKEFRITHMEMIKGIKGHGYHDELVVPIIENAAHEGELTESLSEAIEAYPETTAVLVRNHGIYVWGDSWISAKTQAECYHYLFEAAIRLQALGLDWNTPEHGPIKAILGGYGELYSPTHVRPFRPFILLDIEGTTTPISFVSEVLFPYAYKNVAKHLSSTYDTVETQQDIHFLRSQLSPTTGPLVAVAAALFLYEQIQDDLEERITGAVTVPPQDAGKENVIAAIVANVKSMITADRKLTALKQLQGHIWETGFMNKELKGVVFDDVPAALHRWHTSGVKVYIYSSGSRLAQRLLFANTAHGDLRKYLCGYFDTMVGNKKDSRSYAEISESIGADSPSDVLFVTDVYQEAVAAKDAGIEVAISIRVGNESIPDGHGFRTIHSFEEI